MKAQEITQNNKLIAEFMGLKLGSCKEERWYRWDSINQGQGYFTELKYHSSWDWLMLVVEKIENLGFKIDMSYSHCIIINGLNCKYFVDITVLKESKIQAVYEAVIKFIKWYNENK